MKKILIMASVVCCMMLITGCGNKRGESETTCKRELSNGDSLVYTYVHNKNKISQTLYKQTFVYESLSSAINDGKLFEEGCEQTKKGVVCDVTRKNKTLIVNTSYECATEKECNYENVIKKMEQEGYICEEK